jgi:hypothetical protein
VVSFAAPPLLALASPRRLEILRLLWNEERPAGSIHAAMPEITFGAVEAGLVEARREGRHRYYRARTQALGPVGRLLEETWANALWRLKLRAELEAGRRGPRPRRRRRRAPHLREE